MATVAAGHPLPHSASDDRTQLRRAVIASTIGTTIEWYDFFLYSIVTGLVFAKLFFPQSDPLTGTLQAFAIYAVGSNRNSAYLSGIGVGRTRVGAYLLAGLFTGLGGLALSASSGIGDPNSGATYTLNSVAAVVLGGVSLLGGFGGLVGVIAAAYVLTLSKIILLLRGTDPNYANVYQGALIILVVVIGGLITRKTRS